MSDSKNLDDLQKIPGDKVRRLVRPHLLALRPYVPGRPAADVMREFGLSEVVKLASNENPAGPSPKAIAAIERLLPELHLYPDGAGQDVRGAIAQHVDLTAEHVFIGNGSDEVIKLIMETFLDAGDELLVPFPSFMSYTSSAAMVNARLVQVPLQEDFQYNLNDMVERVTPRTKVIVLCTPNNPTGTWLTHTQVAEFLQRIPDRVLVVIDEAYLEYVDTADRLDSLQFIREGRAVISLRTFSKMYGLAGLRLGYALADPSVLAYLQQVRLPFNVNAVAQAGCAAALADDEHVARSRALNAAGRAQYHVGLGRLGISYIPTQGNFLLARVGDGQAVFEALMRRGVIVRAGFAGLTEYIRISIGTKEQNERCLEALATLC
ncbi:MAG: histidinol-phosphate transaminase [Firmicutes bacterium]|nr:histidinol-phosphate transaminase [Bacillota bacterium]